MLTLSAIIVVNDKDNGIETRTHAHTHGAPFILPSINIIMTVLIHTDSHWGMVRIIQSGDY